MKTIGIRGTLFSDTPIYIYIIGMGYGRIGMNDQSSTGFFGDVQRYSHIQDDPGLLYIISKAFQK